MRKLYFIFIALSVSVSAASQQKDDRLYVRDDDVVGSIAGGIKSSDKSIPEEAVRSIIKETFKEYWKQSSNRSRFQDMERLESEAKVLARDTLAYRSSLDSLNRGIDSLEALNKSLEELLKTAPAASIPADLTLRKDSLEKANGSCRSDIGILSGKIAELDQAIALLDDEISASREKLSGLDAQSQNIQQAVQTLPERAERMAASCGGSLLAMDLKEAAEVSAQFREYGDMLKSMDPAKYKKCSASVAVISRYADVAEVLQNSVKQMGEKFDKSRNQTLAGQIKTRMKSFGQNAECKAVLDALNSQEKAYKNLTYIIKYVRDCQDDSDFSMSDAISTVGVVSPGKTRYCEYYTRFNAVLDKLESMKFDIDELEGTL